MEKGVLLPCSGAASLAFGYCFAHQLFDAHPFPEDADGFSGVFTPPLWQIHTASSPDLLLWNSGRWAPNHVNERLG